MKPSEGLGLSVCQLLCEGAVQSKVHFQCVSTCGSGYRGKLYP